MGVDGKRASKVWSGDEYLDPWPATNALVPAGSGSLLSTRSTANAPSAIDTSEMSASTTRGAERFGLTATLVVVGVQYSRGTGGRPKSGGGADAPNGPGAGAGVNGGVAAYGDGAGGAYVGAGGGAARRSRVRAEAEA